MKFSYKRLDEIGSVSRGRSKHRPRNAPELYGGPYPFVQTADVKKAGLYLTEYSQTYSEKGLAQSKLWPTGTLCITIAANIADTAILGVDACFPDSVIGFISDDSKSNVKYVKYLFDCTLQTEFKKFSQGAAQDNLSQEKLLSIKFPVPDIECQNRIVAILSDYDSAIDNARRQIALLEEAAMRLYREWFRDRKGETCLLRDFIYFQEGPGIRNWQYVESKGVRFINIRCIKNGDVDISNASMISSDEAFGKYRHFQLQEDDIVMSCSGTLGRSAVIRKDHLPLCLNTSVIRFRPKLDDRDYSYIYCYLNSDDFLDSQKAMANGAAQLNFGPKHLNLIQMDLPSHDARYVFNEHVLPMLAAKKRLHCQIRKLTEARDRLLPKLMSGEIEV